MSEDFQHSGEVAGFVLGVVVALFAAAVAVFIARNRSINQGRTAYLVALRIDGRYRLGQAQVSTASVKWFPMRSLSMRPAHVWRRGDLDLGAPHKAPRTSYISITEAVRVSCTAESDTFEITLNMADYTALRSWSESAPPGIHADVA
ncbi:MAG: DUF2550 family protein [Allobranchiibius sp.]